MSQAAREASLGSVPKRIYRRRGIFAAVFLTTVVAIAAPLMLMPATYSTTGSIIVGEQEPTASPSSAALMQKLGDPADVESQLLIIKSPRMQRLALAKPGVADAIVRECEASRQGWLARLTTSAKSCQFAFNSPALLDFAQRRYSIDLVGRSRVIAISFRSQLPDVAFILTNALVITYLDEQRTRSAQGREAASTWILDAADGFLPYAERARATAPAGANSTGSASPSIGSTPATGAAAEADPANLDPRRAFLLELFKKTNGLETDRRVPLISARLVNVAEMPLVPVFPKKKPILLAAIAIGLLAGLAASVLRDLYDPNVRSLRDFEYATGLHVIGQIPLLTTDPFEQTSSGEPDTPGGILGHLGAWRAEASRLLLISINPVKRRLLERAPIRAVRLSDAIGSSDASLLRAASSLYAHLAFDRRADLNFSLLVTSAVPGEGKTFTSLVLARSIAANGRKVLIIDCNLRRPAVAAAFRLRPARTLIDVLRDTKPFETAVLKTSIDNVFAIAAGPSAADPTALLWGDRLAQLLRWAKQEYFVILDGPVSDGLLDAKLIASNADVTLLCARWGRTKVTATLAAAEELPSANGRPNVVITQLPEDEHKLYEFGRLAQHSPTDAL